MLWAGRSAEILNTCHKAPQVRGFWDEGLLGFRVSGLPPACLLRSLSLSLSLSLSRSLSLSHSLSLSLSLSPSLPLR